MPDRHLVAPVWRRVPAAGCSNKWTCGQSGSGDYVSQAVTRRGMTPWSTPSCTINMVG